MDKGVVFQKSKLNEMAAVAQMMGKANNRRLSRLKRLEEWWDAHPRTALVLGMLAVAIMVGVFLRHFLTYSL